MGRWGGRDCPYGRDGGPGSGPKELGKGGKLMSPMGRRELKNFERNMPSRTQFGIPQEKWDQMSSEEQTAHKRSLGYND